MQSEPRLPGGRVAAFFWLYESTNPNTRSNAPLADGRVEPMSDEQKDPHGTIRSNADSRPFRSTAAKTAKSSPTRSPIRSSAPRPTRSPTRRAVIDFIEQKLPREEYGRYGNPSEKVVERKLAALDGGEEALLFSSGMAAIVGLLMSQAQRRRRGRLLRRVLSSQPRVLHASTCRGSASTTRQVPACDYEAMEAAITPRPSCW